MYISSLVLNTDNIAAIRSQILPYGETRLDATHKLMWNLTGDHPGRERDFLWCETAPDTFRMLSRREPVDKCNFFTTVTRPFEPKFFDGDNLYFTLRVNATATVRRKVDGPCREEIGTSELRQLMSNGKPTSAEKQEVRVKTALSWLDNKGKISGFTLDEAAFAVDKHEFITVKRQTGKIQFGALELSGILTVTDPDTFLVSLTKGFGRAKAFGCGLMSVRLA